MFISTYLGDFLFSFSFFISFFSFFFFARTGELPTLRDFRENAHILGVLGELRRKVVLRP